MNPIPCAPRLRWSVPSFFTILGLACFSFVGWTLFEIMEEEQALEVLFQPNADSMQRARSAELWAERGEES
ncbi:MAG: hypothetical protein KDA84_03725, partial [Planctomycetaceae bacterium]|nr:hypothetical protein [Planctomycetaceae bacterium]